MLHTIRRLLTGTVLVSAVGAGMLVAPQVASAAEVAATVQVGSTLQVRSAPSLSARVVGTVRNQQRVTVRCSVIGTTVRGRVRTTNVWDRLSAGRYLPHAYIRSTRPVPRCVPASPQAVPVRTKPASSAAVKIGTIRSTDGGVNVRTAPSTSGAVRDTLANGEKVSLVCGVAGEYVAGTVRATTQWDRTTSGTYVSHAYVVTPTLTLCKGTTTPPTTSATMSTAQFIAAAVPGAQQGWREYGVPPSVTIAQAILESGWGRSGLSTNDRNYFGIKCFNGKYGTLANGCHIYRTQECTKTGTCFTTTATFRTYASMANSFRDHGSFLRVNSRYKPAFAYTRNANKFIWNVWKAGYATDPNYYTKITGIMAANQLYQYDTWK
jgi:flagellum-specific peptidoglycan hydrolase FlgJ